MGGINTDEKHYHLEKRSRCLGSNANCHFFLGTYFDDFL